MTDNQELQQESSVNRARISMIVFGCLAIAGVAWGYLQMQAARRVSEDALAQALADNAALQTQMANLKETVADIKTAELYQQEEQTLAKDEIVVVLTRAESVEESLVALADNQAKWQVAIEELKDSQLGRRLAANPEFVDLLTSIQQSAPSGSLSAELKSRLAPLLTQLQNSLSEPTVAFKPTEAFIQRIDEIATAASQANRWCHDHLLELAALKEHAAELEPAERTLRTAMLAREAERAQGRVAVLAERNREAQQQADETVGATEAEATRIIAEAQAQAKRLLGESTAAQIVHDAEEVHARQQDALRRQQEAERLAQLRREYERDLPDIRVKLQPFITDGHTYNNDSLEAAPVSLSVLRGQGALNEGRIGVERLLYIGGTNTNDRQRGAFPLFEGGEFGWNRLDKAFMGAAQGYLRKYGELMVEEGLLLK